jgi:hypothetical protein
MKTNIDLTLKSGAKITVQWIFDDHINYLLLNDSEPWAYLQADKGTDKFNEIVELLH